LGDITGETVDDFWTSRGVGTRRGLLDDVREGRTPVNEIMSITSRPKL
jgi:hypothetical protein